MNINDALIQSGIERFSKMNKRATLPTFDELPNIELYMDQVIALVNRYLAFFCENEDENVITHAMINNYVKQKIIPVPVKKRYSRVHLACLIMIGALKQTLSIPTIEFLLPNDCDEKQAEVIYNKFVDSWENSFDMAIEMLEEQLKMLAEQKRYDDVYNLATDMAVGSNVFKVFIDKMIYLHPDNAVKKAEKQEKKKSGEKEPKKK